jgi:hypothetical protein
MAKKPHPGRRGDPVSLHPLTPEQAISGMFKIKPEDVKRIVGKRPIRRRKGKK